MTAFCACCGENVTLKTEACPLCGAPQHGMLPPDLVLTFDVITDRLKMMSNRSGTETVADA